MKLTFELAILMKKKDNKTYFHH